MWSRKKSSKNPSPFRPLTEEIFSTPVQGIVTSTIQPRQVWRVNYQGVSWRATLYRATTINSILPGRTVTLVGRKGNTLLIQAN